MKNIEIFNNFHIYLTIQQEFEKYNTFHIKFDDFLPKTYLLDIGTFEINQRESEFISYKEK